MFDMQTMGERIKRLRETAQDSLEALGTFAGVSKQAIQSIETGKTKEPAASTIERIAAKYRRRMAWLVTGRGREIEGGDGGEWEPVYAYHVYAALGDPQEPDEYAEVNKLHFRAESLRKHGLTPSMCAVVYGKGESMEPTILDGDALLVERADNEPKHLKNGAIYVVDTREGLLAKRILRDGAHLFLASDNRAIKRWAVPQPVKDLEGLRVFGRVRWVGGWRE